MDNQFGHERLVALDPDCRDRNPRADFVCRCGIARDGGAGFAQVLAKQREQSGELLALALGGLLAATCVGALESALGLVFDPRYRDFPCAWLTLAAVPFAVASVRSGRWGARPGTAEIVMAVVLAASAGYIALNKSFANWQAVWTASMLVLIAGSLMSLQQAVPSSR